MKSDYLNKIICGDAYKIIKKIPTKSIDCVMTDPPYLQHTGGGTSPKSGLYRNIHRGSLDHLSNGFDYSIFEEMIRVCKIVNLQIFCSNRQISSIMGYFEDLGYSVTLMTFLKTNPIPLAANTLLSDCEYIVYVRGKGATFNKLHYKEMSKVTTLPIVSHSKRLHDCQKPELLIEKYMKLFTNKKDVVLDCFLGSGTTAAVAKRMGRNYIGIEHDKEICNIAQKRLANL